MMDDTQGIAIAFEEAKLSYSEGGIPVCRTYSAPPPPAPNTLNLQRQPHN